MGWFDEQIKQRMKNDDEAFSEAFSKIAWAITGKPYSSYEFDNRSKQSRSAMDEILKYFRIRPQDAGGKYKNLDEMMEASLRPYGIMHRNVRLKNDWYKNAIGAMLGSRNDGEVIALIPYGEGYRYLDGKTGEYVRITKANAGDIDSSAICFYSPLPLKKLGIRDLLKFLAHIPSPSDIALIVVVTLFISLLGLLIPKINQLIFSTVVVSGELGLLFATLGLLAGVTVSSILIEVAKTILQNRVQVKMDISIESATMMRVLSLPSGFFKQYSPGDIGSRMQAIGSLCSLLTDAILSTGLSSLFSLIYIGQIFQFAPALVIPAVAITLATFLVSVVTSLVQIRISMRKMECSAKEQGMIYSMFSGIQKIKLAGAEKRFFARWADQYVKVAQLSYSPPGFIKYNMVFTTAISLLGTVAIYVCALESGVSVSDYMAFNSAYGMVSGAFAALASIAVSTANIKPILDMAKPIMETVPEIAENKPTVERLSGEIELSHVSFQYSETMPLVIDDLSLKIRPGQYVAIVGSTGCGKSTLIRIMLGFEKPQKGAVYYDGKDLNALDLKSVRQKIGVVMQNGKLFSGDIYSNIVISAPTLSMEEAWEAAEMAGLADDIRNMPMGMNTLISEGSGGISGGQKQRLMIARAVAPKPRILMFDEATSALDNITQKTVSESLDKMKCTRIVIAHRLSTIRQCDRILVLDKGKIIEDGTYDELIEKNGFFAELVSRQQLQMPEK